MEIVEQVESDVSEMFFQPFKMKIVAQLESLIELRFPFRACRAITAQANFLTIGCNVEQKL